MAGYLIGAAFLAFAAWTATTSRLSKGERPCVGTVIEEVSRTSTKTGRRTRVHAPRVAYTHPDTGADATLEPTTFGTSRFAPGDPVALAHNPATGTVRRLRTTTVKDTVVLTAVGAGFIIAQLLS